MTRCVLIINFALLVFTSAQGITRAHVGKLNSEQPVEIKESATVVARVWQGRVTSARADAYYKYLFEAGVKKIQGVAGNLGVQVLRRQVGDVTHFTVISYWPSRTAIKAFAGEDIEKPRHLPKDTEYLLELPEHVLHYDVAYSDVSRIGVGAHRR